MSTVSSQLALGIPSLCLPRLGMQAGHHAYLVLCVVSGDLNAVPPPNTHLDSKSFNHRAIPS